MFVCFLQIFMEWNNHFTNWSTYSYFNSFLFLSSFFFRGGYWYYVLCIPQQTKLELKRKLKKKKNRNKKKIIGKTSKFCPEQLSYKWHGLCIYLYILIFFCGNTKMKRGFIVWGEKNESRTMKRQKPKSICKLKCAGIDYLGPFAFIKKKKLHNGNFEVCVSKAPQEKEKKNSSSHKMKSRSFPRRSRKKGGEMIRCLKFCVPYAGRLLNHKLRTLYEQIKTKANMSYCMWHWKSYDPKLYNKT